MPGLVSSVKNFTLNSLIHVQSVKLLKEPRGREELRKGEQ